MYVVIRLAITSLQRILLTYILKFSYIMHVAAYISRGELIFKIFVTFSCSRYLFVDEMMTDIDNIITTVMKMRL